MTKILSYNALLTELIDQDRLLLDIIRFHRKAGHRHLRRENLLFESESNFPCCHRNSSYRCLNRRGFAEDILNHRQPRGLQLATGFFVSLFVQAHHSHDTVFSKITTLAATVVSFLPAASRAGVEAGVEICFQLLFVSRPVLRRLSSPAL